MKLLIKIAMTLVFAAVMGWVAFGFFGIQALFVDQEVNEEIPAIILAEQGNPVAGATSSPTAGLAILGKGAFQQGDSTYTITGDAYLSAAASHFNLTFTDFKVTNGPDLYVYAVKTDSTQNETVKATVAAGDFISLGRLKGNIGNQNYNPEINLKSEGYHVVSIWCKRFGRNFGAASLEN